MSTIPLMALSNFPDLVRIIQQDVITDKQNLFLIQRTLAEILDLKKTVGDTLRKNTLQFRSLITTQLQAIIQFATADIQLDEYGEQRTIDLLVGYIEEVDEQLPELDTELEQDMKKLKLLGLVQSITLQEFKFLPDQGYTEEYRSLRAMVQSVQRNSILLTLVRLEDLYTELEEVEEYLLREQRIYESKIRKQTQGLVLQKLQESRKNYAKDSILLLEGLLQLDEWLYPQLKGQMDEYYRTLMHGDMVKLNKVVSMQTKTIIDEADLKRVVRSYKNIMNKLLKKL